MKRIGIDLGTTNSCVYYLDESGNPVLVTDDRGNGIFPSAVWCAGKGKERVVGHKAKARMGNQPSPIIAVKRKMGTDQKVMLGGELVSAVEVSIEILRHCKKLVEAATNDTVGAVVVTVPAYFDVSPMRDTQLAALEAFFGGDETSAKGRLELQLEPEAAACAYLAEDPAEQLLVLVYDLGGGTFDVTVLEKNSDGLAAIAFGGDPHLGGDNVDDRLASWISYRIRGGKAEALDRLLAPGRYDAEIRYTVLQQVLANDVDGLCGVLRSDDRDLLIPDPPRYDLDLDATNPEDLVRIQKLKWLAENAKKELTIRPEVAIVQQGAIQDHAGELVDVDLDLSLKAFNLLIGDMIDKTVRATLAVVEKSGKQRSDFDRVLLVGGSSRMNVVMDELSKIFTCPVLLAKSATGADLIDKIVALGAAMHAGSLNLGPESSGELLLEYPRQTADSRVSIAGRLPQVIEDARAYLTRTGGEREQEVQDVAVHGDRFLLQGVELTAEAENRFRVEVLDGTETELAVAEISILQKKIVVGSEKAKLTKPIRFLGRKGFKILFPEGEPLPATTTEICYRAGKGSFVLIPIYQGERPLRDLRIDGIGSDVNVGAEIKLTVTIEKDYNVRGEAVISKSGQKASVDFRIEPIQMPSLEQLERDMETTIEEIEDGVGIIKDPNKRAGFRKSVRQLKSDFTKARNANEPDAHHLFTLVGELRKIKTEVDNSQEFLTPPLEDFHGLMRVCGSKASKLEPNAAVSKDEVLKKISALESAGQDAWDREDKREWAAINKEAQELLESLNPPSAPQDDPDPADLAKFMLEWLDEIAEKATDAHREEEFAPEIKSVRGQIRDVDLDDEAAARKQLKKIVREKIKPLEKKLTGSEEEGDQLTDW